jgi:protein-L-isoaspartate(D-aspartate) O-methyltransferase
MVDYATARMNMVESQLRTNRVNDQRLLEAFETVPRERFVPEHLKSLAYVDEDLRLKDDRYLVEPMVQARLMNAAEIRASDVVMVVGASTGYACAILARIAATVVGLESDPELAKHAETTLQAEGVDNAVIIQGDLPQGYAKQGPYDVIIVNGAVAEVPKTLTDQLSPEGGRLATVVRAGSEPGKGSVFERWDKAVGRRTLFDANTPVLPGFRKQPGFVF